MPQCCPGKNGEIGCVDFCEDLGLQGTFTKNSCFHSMRWLSIVMFLHCAVQLQQGPIQLLNADSASSCSPIQRSAARQLKHLKTNGVNHTSCP